MGAPGVDQLGVSLTPLERRVQYGLLGLGMMRAGEVAGLRWGQVDLAETPLGRIVVIASYDGRPKTDAERWMPIHDSLAALLREWKERGWEAMMGRPPEPTDLVLPCPAPTNRGPRKPLGAMRDRHFIWKRMQADLRLLGLRERRVHDLRRTGISLAKEDGAEETILKRGTHAPPKDVMGLYTSVEYAALCREVAKIQLPHVPAHEVARGSVR